MEEEKRKPLIPFDEYYVALDDMFNVTKLHCVDNEGVRVYSANDGLGQQPMQHPLKTAPKRYSYKCEGCSSRGYIGRGKHDGKFHALRHTKACLSKLTKDEIKSSQQKVVDSLNKSNIIRFPMFTVRNFVNKDRFFNRSINYPDKYKKIVECIYKKTERKLYIGFNQNRGCILYYRKDDRVYTYNWSTKYCVIACTLCGTGQPFNNSTATYDDNKWYVYDHFRCAGSSGKKFDKLQQTVRKNISRSPVAFELCDYIPKDLFIYEDFPNTPSEFNYLMDARRSLMPNTPSKPNANEMLAYMHEYYSGILSVLHEPNTSVLSTETSTSSSGTVAESPLSYGNSLNPSYPALSLLPPEPSALFPNNDGPPPAKSPRKD